MDRVSEQSEKGTKIGTTGRGIGPAYADKAARIGLRVSDLFRPDDFKSQLERVVERANVLLCEFYDDQGVNAAAIFDQYMTYAERLAEYVGDCGAIVRQAVADGKKVLAEGAQGTMLDIDQGTYPFVTSSQSTCGGVCVGLGVPPKSITETLGIMKAYTTRVGEGPFPTELTGDDGEKLRQAGGEYGATTGRPRRCGWLDTVVGRYAVALNGIDSIALTKLDVLDGFDEIKVCVAYGADGETFDTMPETTHTLECVKPVHETLPGWKTPTAGMDSYTDLPDNAKRYIDRVEELVEAPVSIISTGEGREATIVR